jgi:hypothetical protein
MIYSISNNCLNNNLLRFIGKYNMISKESVLLNKVKVINDIYCSSGFTFNIIKHRIIFLNRSRENFPDLFKKSDDKLIKMFHNKTF